MSIKPILFNTDMVRAILDGRKTVTRRCVKPRSKNACGFCVIFRESDNAVMGVYDYDEYERQFDSAQTPPCQPGDILYVREPWAQYNGFYLFKTHCQDTEFLLGQRGVTIKWRPSIHMPKAAVRIWLKVMDVRVERLQDITSREILAEGIVNQKSNPAMGKRFENMQKMEFEKMWNFTIKKSDLYRYGWAANPWVWAIEFERCENPEE